MFARSLAGWLSGRSVVIASITDFDWGLGTSDASRLVSQERTLLRTRVGVLAFAIVDTALGQWLGVSAPADFAPLIVVGGTCVLVAAVLRRDPPVQTMLRLGRFAMASDTLVVAGLMLLYAGELDSSIFLLAVIVPLEAALRWPRRGGVLGGVCAGLLTLGWSLYQWERFGFSTDLSTLMFRFGMMVVIGVLAGAALRRLEARSRVLRRTLEVSRDLIAVMDWDGTIRSVNPAALAILGYRPEELVGRNASEFIADGSPPASGLAGMVEHGLQHRVEYRIKRRDGTEAWLEIDVALVPEERVAYCVARDTSDRRRMEDALRSSEMRSREAAERYSSLVDRNPDAVFAQDLEGGFQSLNQACADLVGYAEEELLDPSFDPTTLTADPAYSLPFFQRAIGGESVDFETRIRHRTGRLVDIHLTYVPIVVEGALVGVFGVAKDITEQRRLERQLSHQAFHDTLTGLPNRALFLDRLGHALTRHHAVREMCAVLFLDLDHFKLVNDSMGHHEGDCLLQLVARRLAEALEPGHTISRFGGDEFTVLVEGLVAPREAYGYAETLLTALERPFDLRGQEVFCTASIGIAVSDSNPVSPEELLRRADSAMYGAKEAGRGRYAVFDSLLHDRAVARLTIESELRRAVERREFVLHYQPLVCLSSGRLAGVEALVRWDHPRRGLLAPATFLPAATASHVLEHIGEWVIDEACRQLRCWSASPLTASLAVNVNLSAPELVRPESVDHIAGALAAHGVAPDRLVLEITESVLMDDPSAVVNVLARLKALGVRIAVDDFGTGYSSLAYLHSFPVDIIKIDRAFVDGLGRQDGDDTIVAAVLNLTRALNLMSVAEGVERPDQLTRLLALGCDLAQGYLLAPPGPADRIGLLCASGPWNITEVARVAG